MTHLDFIAWMLLFPVSNSVCMLLEVKAGKPYEPMTSGTSLVLVTIWLGIGYLLF